MRAPYDSIIREKWLEHTAREIGALIGKSPEYVRVRAQRMNLPKKREAFGVWQRRREGRKAIGSYRHVVQSERNAAPVKPTPQPEPKPVRLPRVWRNPPIVRFKTCQWMLGNGCTAPTKDGSPWCDEHKARVFARGERANV